MPRAIFGVLLAAAIVIPLGVFPLGLAANPAAAATPGPVAGDPSALSNTVLINEAANGGPASDSDGFFELRNWGDEAVDLTGWHVFRCSWQGLRSNVGRPETDLSGVILQPGDVYTVSKIGMPGDAHVTQPFSTNGFGLYLEGPDGQRVDAIGVYPNEPWPTQSECTIPRGNEYGNLTNSLDFAMGESWQRVAATGDPAVDFVAAASTIGAPNTRKATPQAIDAVEITELAGSGPAADDDEFIELENTGSTPVAIGGWEVFRCSATGRARPNTLQLTIEDDAVLAPGDRYVIGGQGFTGAADGHDADATWPTQLADVEFGVLIRTGSGELVDRVAVSAYGDSACQAEGAKLPSILDAVAGESWQRTDDGGFVVAPRTPGKHNAQSETSVLRTEFAYPNPIGVAISELADDPSSDALPDGSEQRNYIEVANYGEVAVDVSGWTVRRCEASGIRSRGLQFTVPDGTLLEPGEVFLAARAGTPTADLADVTYDTSLNFLGTGVWLEDAAGTRIDSVGVFAQNEMDASNVIDSPCTKGTALTTYQPDRMLSETFQRAAFTGIDTNDFVVAEATPGVIDLLGWVDPTVRVAAIQPAALSMAGSQTPSRLHALLRETAQNATAPATVLETFSGVAASPLESLVGSQETSDALEASDQGFGLPYQRIVLDASTLAEGSTVEWTGRTASRNELQLSVWSGEAWRLLDAASSADPGAAAPVILAGTLVAADIIDGTVTLLVQDGPRTEPTISSGIDGALENPADYDFAITHVTDTQYLSESYPEVYTQLVSWIADQAADRKIEFVTHTGDLVQNWVDPNQSEPRARIEFERASAIQSILDDAGIPNSVLPGNHDNKRGVSNDLFNEYFGPERYEGTDWYGGSIAPGDNSANFSTFEQDGAKFLMLSLPYAYGEAEMVWAEEIVTSHPDYNVIISTHEHVMPKTLEESAHRSSNSRWVSHGAELWERVIAPNRNVVIVLSGHFHGLGQLVTENAGGLEGHTVVELLADYQEFRTHTGERATGFFRMLQIDLDQGAIAVDTRSMRLDASVSAEYDYRQFLPDNGLATTPSNVRPWNIVETGLQHRYGAEDDEFTAYVTLQHPKRVATETILVSAPVSVQ